MLSENLYRVPISHCNMRSRFIPIANKEAHLASLALVIHRFIKTNYIPQRLLNFKLQLIFELWSQAMCYCTPKFTCPHLKRLSNSVANGEDFPRVFSKLKKLRGQLKILRILA